MKRLNIHSALMALEGTATKEDIIIQVAKQQNIRFNDLPQLQIEVDQALDESHRLGFVDRQGKAYKLIFEQNQIKKDKKEGSQLTCDALQGQGDGRRSRIAVGSKLKSPCLGCSGMEVQTNQSFLLDKQLLCKEKSICSVCGENSESQLTLEDLVTTDGNWLGGNS